MHWPSEQHHLRMFGIRGSLGAKYSSLLRGLQAATTAPYRQTSIIHSTVAAALQDDNASDSLASHETNDARVNVSKHGSGDSSRSQPVQRHGNLPGRRCFTRSPGGSLQRRLCKPPAMQKALNKLEQKVELLPGLVNDVAALHQQLAVVSQQLQSAALLSAGPALPAHPSITPAADSNDGISSSNGTSNSSSSVGSSVGGSNGASSGAYYSNSTPGSSSSTSSDTCATSNGGRSKFATFTAAPPVRPTARPRRGPPHRVSAPLSSPLRVSDAVCSAKGTGSAASNSSSSSIWQNSPPVSSDAGSNDHIGGVRGSSSFHSSSSSLVGPWHRKGYMYSWLTSKHLQTIAGQGLEQLPNWGAWGDRQLLQAWQEATLRLPAAVSRLAAVSLQGPTKLVCFDFETTKIWHPVDVVELAAVSDDGCEAQWLVSPISSIPSDASDVHGLFWKDVQNSPPLPVVLLGFVEWLTEQCSRSPGGSSTLVLLGHNITKFDIQVLRDWMFTALNVQQMEELLSTTASQAHQSWVALDTLTVAKKLSSVPGADDFWRQVKLLRLQTLREAFGIPQEQQHRALEDCKANLEVFIRMMHLQPGWDPAVTDAAALAERWLAQEAAERNDNTIPERAMGRSAGAAPQPTLQQQQQAGALLPEAAAQDTPQQQPSMQQPAAAQQQQAHEQQQQQAKPVPASSTACSDNNSGDSGSSNSSRGKSSSTASSTNSRSSSTSSRPTTPTSSTSTSGTTTSSSSSSWRVVERPVLDPEVIEAKVTQALERLTERDLHFSWKELSQAWPPLGDDPATFKKIFTAIQHEKLEAAGLNNLLKVLTYAPRILQYNNCIRLTTTTTTSSSSSGLQSEQQTHGATAVASSNNSSSSSTVDEADAELQLVDLVCKTVAATRLIATAKGGLWNTVYEVPTDPPTQEPIYLKVVHFQPGRPHFAIAACNNAKAKAQVQATAFVRGKVKPSEYGKPTAGFDCTWETVGLTEVEYVDPDSSSSSSTGSMSGDNTAAAEAARATRHPLVPIYKALKPLQSSDFLSTGRGKGIIDRALDAVRNSPDQGELLSQDVLERYKLPKLVDALTDLHQPTSMEALRAARRRLAFQELMLLQMAQLLERCLLQRGLQSGSATSGRSGAVAATVTADAITATDATGDIDVITSDQPAKRNKRGRPKQAKQEQQQWQEAASAYQITDISIVSKARQVLPYQLTEHQEKALSEVLADIAKPQPMLRLLQGDVGCGKTVVAVLACLAVYKSGCQALMLAPTELLASQHFQTLSMITEQLSLADRPRIQLLTGGSSLKEKKEAHNAVKNGVVDIIVSTQAALWIPAWAKLGLVIVDEQHKWGVKQREMLGKRVQAPPHMLLMTATPIPRTLALVQHGVLTLSTISQMPPGRTPVRTRVVMDSETTREEVYQDIRAELDRGGRVYIVCALVEESDMLDGVKAAEQEYRRLSKHGVFGQHNCGLLHGKMDKDQKAEALRKFNSGEAPVLISSTVVEVGIDEPEASIMLVENAARFGLAQLHQLRGRVGRGTRASRCFLIAPQAGDAAAAVAAERLQVLEESHNGLVIAEADLNFRGPGDVWGVKQSGKPSALTHLAWDELQADPQLVDHARADVADLLLHLGSEPQLKAALLAYGLMTLPEDGKLPRLRDGVSGV